MDCARKNLRRVGRLLAPLAMLAAVGCQTVRTPEEQIARTPVPRELNKMSMPEYVVSPPDLLVVEVLEALPGRPISGERLVRPDGTITLGFYGDVYVNGLTVSEIKEKIVIHLRKYLTDEVLGLTGLGPDNNPIAIPPKDSDRIFVDVAAYNSQVYYVQGDVAAPGGCRLPATRRCWTRSTTRVDWRRWRRYRISGWFAPRLRERAIPRCCRSTCRRLSRKGIPRRTTSSCLATGSSCIATRSSAPRSSSIVWRPRSTRWSPRSCSTASPAGTCST